jgi:hypothetical protein
MDKAIVYGYYIIGDNFNTYQDCLILLLDVSYVSKVHKMKYLQSFTCIYNPVEVQIAVSSFSRNVPLGDIYALDSLISLRFLYG